MRLVNRKIFFNSFSPCGCGRCRFRLLASHFALLAQSKVTKGKGAPIPQIATSCEYPPSRKYFIGRLDATSCRGKPKAAVHGCFPYKIFAPVGCYDGECHKHSKTIVQYYCVILNAFWF